MLNVLDLFSGIGGFSLGLERTGGFRTVAFCEAAPYPRQVLAKHWPEVPCYEDVRTLTADRLAADGLDRVDVICGGFPCQDISLAGKGAGITGARSGLWFEYARIIEECRPAWVIIENVTALRSRGLDQVLGSLSALGYDAEWHCIPAGAIGARHRRDRVWIVAYPVRDGRQQDGCDVARGSAPGNEGPTDWFGDGCAHVANARSPRLPQPQREAILGAGWRDQVRAASERSWWSVEPDVVRMAHGVPKRVDRLKALGNAVVPQIPELIGRAILASVT